MKISKGRLKIGESIVFDYVPVLTALSDSYEFSEEKDNVEKEDLASKIIVDRYGLRAYMVKLNSPPLYNRYSDSDSRSKRKRDILVFNDEFIDKFHSVIADRDVFNLLFGNTIYLNSLTEVNLLLELLEEKKEIINRITENHKDIFGTKTYNSYLAKENINVHIEKCDRCGKLVKCDNDTMKATPYGEMYCNECYDKRFFACNNCGEVVEINKMCSCRNKNRVYSTELLSKHTNEENVIYYLNNNYSEYTQKVCVTNIYGISKTIDDNTEMLMFPRASYDSHNKVTMIYDFINAKLEKPSFFSYIGQHKNYMKHSTIGVVYKAYEEFTNNNVHIGLPYTIQHIWYDKDSMFIKTYNSFNTKKFFSLIISLLNMSYKEIYDYLLSYDIGKLF